MTKTKRKSGRGVEGRPGRRYELRDEAFERIEPLLPKQKPGGRWNDHRTVLNGMFWVLSSGAPWRDLPERYGPWKTVYGRFRRWSQSGLFQQLLAVLEARARKADRIDFEFSAVDGSIVRAHKSAAGAPKKGLRPKKARSNRR